MREPLIQSLLPFLLVWMALLMLYCTGVAVLGGSHCSSMGEVPFSDSGCALPKGMLPSHTLLAFISFLLYLFYYFLYLFIFPCLSTHNEL